MQKQEQYKNINLSDIKSNIENLSEGKGYQKHRYSLSTDVVDSYEGGLDKQYEKLLEFQNGPQQEQGNIYPEMGQFDSGESNKWSNQPNYSYQQYNTQWQVPNQMYENVQHYPQIQINTSYQPYQTHHPYQSFHQFHHPHHFHHNYYNNHHHLNPYYYPQNTGHWHKPHMQVPQPKSEVIKLQNKEKQADRWRGRGRGRGKWFSGFRQRGGRCRRPRSSSPSSSSLSKSGHKKSNHHSRQPHHRKYEQKEHKIKNQGDQWNIQKSETQNQTDTIEKEMQKMSLKSGCQQKINNFELCLEPFFTKYNISPWGRKKILMYLSLNFQTIEDLNPLIATLFGLQETAPEYFIQSKLRFFGIVREIVKRKYQIEQIKKRLDKKIQIKQKKQKHDSKFRESFPNAVDIDFLELRDLYQLNKQKTLFLVDCNNIMPKQKKFRLYFQNMDEGIKAQGQIRLIWLFGLAVKAELFFDNKYSNQLYNEIKLQILTQQEEDMVNKVPVHYASKHISQDNTADMKIVERLKQIIESKQYQHYQIVLVSADNELGQLCHEIFPIKKTSGRYIFKYCKQMIRQKFFHQPEMKGIIKTIFAY